MEYTSIYFSSLETCKSFFIGKDASCYNILLNNNELKFIPVLNYNCNILDLSNNNIQTLPQKWIPLCNKLILNNNCIDNIPTFFKGKIIYNNDTYEHINQIISDNKILEIDDINSLLKLDVMLLNTYVKTLYSILNIKNKNEQKTFIENCKKIKKHRNYFDNNFKLNKDIFLSNEECIALFLITNNNVIYFPITKLLEYQKEEQNKLMSYIAKHKSFY